MQHVFIVGSKGIPGAYGGYETFVDKLTEYHESCGDITYHVACKSDTDHEFEYHGARCFAVRVPHIGSVQAVYYDLVALRRSVSYIREHAIEHPIVYVLACRIGPWCAHFARQIHRLGGKLYVNPDGHEWMRAKWSAPVRRYWKLSERLMVKHSDMLVCDSKNIEAYIQREYHDYAPKTVYIAYGAEVFERETLPPDDALCAWYSENGIGPDSYYLVVGRFVPENNFEVMVREFMRSSSWRDFVLVTNVNDGFLRKLEERTGFRSDPRIKFVGALYEQDLLRKVRANAHAYLHGHEVGGTNPSLLEALGSTDVNLLLDVSFNREVAEDAGLYWTKRPGSLSTLIDRVDTFDGAERGELGMRARRRVADHYSWLFIAEEYRKLFMGQTGTGDSSGA